jgi:DNA-binding beta-propeller fold protein YncE
MFNYPLDIAVAPDGGVYVTDSGNHRVQHVSAAGEPLGQFGEDGTGRGELYRPGGIAIAADGSLYVSEGGSRLNRFAPR